MKELILIKLGGSLITDKSRPFTLRMNVINRLAKEIHQARKENKNIKLIVAHGGGSFPHVPAKKYEVHKGIINEKSYEGIAKTQDAASRFNRIIVNALLEVSELAISVQPSSACITRNGRILEWYTKPIEMLLDYNMIPVPYGDVGLDLTQGSCIISTEEILNYLAKKLKAERIILCVNVDGVFTSDPNKDKNAKLIPEITQKNYPEIKKYLAGSGGIDITGGMLHKVERSLELTKLEIESEIINGTKPNALKRALLGENVKGTLIR